MRSTQVSPELWLLLSILIAKCETLTPANVALGKITPGSTGDAVRYGSRQAVVDGDRTASLNVSHCTGCFATQRNSFGWWSVNLGTPYFLTSVHIYLPRNNQGAVAPLSEGNTKTLISDGPATIAVNDLNSYSNYHQIDFINPPDAATPTTQTLSLVRYAQYVALVNFGDGETTGLRLAEVEVYGFSESLFVPREIAAGNPTPSAVTLSWKSPTDDQLVITYEYGCGVGAIQDYSETTSGQTNMQQQVNGLMPNTRYNCNVRVKRNTGATQPVTVRTQCDAQSPQSVSFGNRIKMLNDGRRRWRYTVSWELPPGYDSSCLHSTNPYKLRGDGVDMENYHNNSYTYYADGYRPVSISVWTRNKLQVLSQSAAVGSITTAEGLEPQTAPRNIVLTSPSYTCVELSWDPPQYPNAGPQTTVTNQYKCGSMTNWQLVPSDNRKCGYSAYEAVTCEVRVCNRFSGDNRCSNVATSDLIRTRCFTPGEVTNIAITRSDSPQMNSNRKRWKYTVTWRDPPSSEINCASIRSSSPYELKINNGAWANRGSKTSQFYADGHVVTEIQVRVYNDEDFVSDPAMHRFTTDKLGPQTRPQSFQLTPSSSSCVSYSYDAPQHLNSPVPEIYYQVNCNSVGWGNTTTNNRSCSYRPYEEVTCEIRAANTAGESLISSDNTRTLCAAPGEVTNIVLTRSDSPQMNSNRKRWRYTVTWQDPQSSEINCASIRSNSPYQLKVNNGTWANRGSRTFQFYADGHVVIEIQVRVYNNEAFVSGSATHTFTTDKLGPQIRPQNFQLTPSSSSCVSYSYDAPQHLNSPVSEIYYQVNCNSGGWVNTAANNRSCTYRPYEEVTCEIRATNTAGQSLINSDNTRTLCADPSVPLSLALGDLGVVRAGGRDRRRYEITWDAPSAPNCVSLRSNNRYRVHYNGTWRWTSSNQLTYTIHVDGDTEIEVRVRAYNDQNRYSEVTKTITTAPLRPQVMPNNYQLVSNSYDCVTLNWTAPTYQNGQILGYQYNCTGDSTWIVAGGGTASNVTRCNYLAYTWVTCQIRARNNVGVSDADTNTIRTRCAAPTVPRSIRFVDKGTQSNDGRQRRKYRVHWSAPLRANCLSLRSTNKYSLKDADGQWSNTNNNYYDIYTDGNVSIGVEVTATNNENFISAAARESLLTESLRPQTVPRNFQITSGRYDCVNLTWEKPQYPNGEITHYQYKCTGDNSWINVNYPLVTKKYCIYTAYTSVSCEIKATNQIGDSNVATGSTTTLCTYPELPENLTDYIVEDIDKSGSRHRRRIKFHLPKPEVIPNCAEIPDYGIKFGIKFGIVEGEPTANQGRITDLAAVTEYQIVVTVKNNEDFITNKTITYTTGELAPYDKPKMELEFNTSCVILTLGEPENPNGLITHYEYGCAYYDHNISLTKNITVGELGDVAVCGFESASRISCKAVAVNSEGMSPKAEGNGNINLEVRNPIRPVVGKIENKDRVPITLYPIKLENDRTNVSSYIVVVRKVSTTRTIQKRAVPQECQPQEKLYNVSEAANRNHSCYITASFQPEEIVEGGIVLTIGDGSNMGEYYNAPLEENETYEVHCGITGILEGGRSFSQFLDPVTVVLIVVPPTTRPPIEAIVAGTVVPVLVILALIGAFFIYRRRKSRDAADKTDNDNDGREFTPLEPVRPVIPPKPTNQDNGQAYENYVFSPSSIEIVGLLDHVLQKEDEVKQDYKELQKQAKPIMSQAQLTENDGKNKYKGLYPGDSHRVVLQRESNSRETDFINASHMEGASGQNEYIASQGPQPKTLNDFWLMVWQQEVRAIVMVTNVVENSHIKCVQYWPDDCEGPKICNDISIMMASSVEYADFVFRDFKVTKDGKTKHIKQFHFTSWPDHGVPDEMSPFITFYRKVKADTRHTSGPLLVHCSAGVGRTGTFLAMDMALTKAKSGVLDVDLYKCVSEMRTRRPSMVQTEIQYLFLHKVIYEAFTTERYVTPCNELDNRLNSEQIYSNDSDPTCEEFEHLEKMVSIHSLEVSEGKSAENSSKNRDPAILPPSKPTKNAKGQEIGKWLRPKLPEVAYINAVLIDAYRKQGHLIATQLPLEDTRSDFWHMIVFMKVKVVLQLDSAKNGEEFYPDTDGDVTTYGDYTVTRSQTQQDDELSTINFQIVTDLQEWDVVLLQATGWKSNSLPQVPTIKHYFDCLERFQQQTGDGKICVMSSDGAMKCGLIISAYNAVEKMKVEQEVDVYNSAVMARYRRPRFINNVTEYNFLYNVLKYYADQYSDYANFK